MAILGDVSIYSTYCYVMELLKAEGFPCMMVPGVPSFCAVAARLGRSLTEPDRPLHILPGGGPGLGEALDLPGSKVLMKAGRNHRQLLEELEALKQENAELKAKEREYEAAIQENQRLYNLLELTPKDKQFTKEAAMVTARSTSNWESTLTLSKGTNQGIAVDNCVVDEYWNLVGVVAEVGENWCTVRTLIDANMELGGQLVRTGGAAILEGDLALMEEGKLKLTYLPENSQLMSGDLVTTSGRGGVYPSGLVAGHVEEVRTDASGMTDYAVIVPETDLDNLQQVFVIKDFTIVE